MKIACQSCQAKYTIADDKVVGKIVKIRCKKCSATIVINGHDGAGATVAMGAGPMSQREPHDALAGAESWTVNVADGDQRAMTTSEVADAYRAGTIDDETYCWKEGMEDWLPLREIPALHAACTGGAPAPSQRDHEAPPASRARTYEDPVTSVRGDALMAQGSNGHASAAASAGGGSLGVATSASSSGGTFARRSGGRGSGSDLFSNAAQAGSEDDVLTSAPAGLPQVHAPANEGKLLGQRNENSVLFSLAALTSGGAKPAPATAEASGLLDIRQLGEKIAAPKDKETKGSRVDDIMNLGGGGAFTAALAAPPVLAPPPIEAGEPTSADAPRKGKGRMVALIAGGAVLMVAVGVFATMGLRPSEEKVASKDPTPTGSATAEVHAKSEPPPVVSPPETTPVENAPAAAAAPPSPSASVASAPAPTATTSPEPATKETTKAKTTHAAAGGQAGGATASKAPVEEPKEPPKPAALPPPPAGGADQPFNMGEAKARLAAVAGTLGSCKKPDGPTGSGKVQVTFAPNGTVQSAVVSPPFAGTAVGACVASRFSSVRVPAFQGSPFSLNKPFVVN